MLLCKRTSLQLHVGQWNVEMTEVQSWHHWSLLWRFKSFFNTVMGFLHFFIWKGVYPVAGRRKSAAGDDGGGGLWRGILCHPAGADPRPENRNPYWAPRYDRSIRHTSLINYILLLFVLLFLSAKVPHPSAAVGASFGFLVDTWMLHFLWTDVIFSALKQIKWSLSVRHFKRRSKPVSRSIRRGRVLFRDWRLGRFKWHIQKHNH